MFERFTDRARRVVVLAQEEARWLNHDYIGTEHLLLGIVHETHGFGARALSSLGLDIGSLRAQVLKTVAPGAGTPTGHIPFTPRAKKVFEFAFREARELEHRYIGTEHILLGLIREAEGVGAQVLMQSGVDLSDVRAAVIETLGGEEPQAVT